jgi:hypothetical protein
LLIAVTPLIRKEFALDSDAQKVALYYNFQLGSYPAHDARPRRIMCHQ